MFNRFTFAARESVHAAMQAAQDDDIDVVEAANLARAMVRNGETLRALLTRLAIDPVAIEHDLDAVIGQRRRGGLSEADIDALSTIGIDANELLARLEQDLGPDAVQPTSRSRSAWRPFGRRPLSAQTKSGFAHAIRTVVALDDHSIREEHLLIGMALADPDVRSVLARRGTSPDDLIAALRSRPAAQP